MLLREIEIGNLTIILEEEQGQFEIKALNSSGERVFMHIFEDYEIVKSALDDITDFMDREPVSDDVADDVVIEILRLSKNK